MTSQRTRTPPFLSVVIPACNEASCLGENLDQIVRFLESKRCSYEVLVVDDGSTDETAEIASNHGGSGVRLLDFADCANGAEVVFGSRALSDSRIERHQPFPREHLGRLFNGLFRGLRLTSLRDTQCGFKLLRGDLGRTLFRGLRTRGYAFDVELQWRAERAGHRVREVGVLWSDSNHSAIRPLRDGIRMVMDCLRIRFRPRG